MTLQRTPDLQIKKTLWKTLFALRIILTLAVVAYAIIEIMKFESNKEILHFAGFSIFFLLGNFQLGVGRHKAVVSDSEAEGLFILTMFSISAALLELVDLTLDEVLKGLNSPNMSGYIFGISLTETILGFCAVLMVYYSLERFLVLLRSIAFKLKNASL